MGLYCCGVLAACSTSPFNRPVAIANFIVARIASMSPDQMRLSLSQVKGEVASSCVCLCQHLCSIFLPSRVS